MVDPNRQLALRDAIELLFFGYREFTDRPDRILDQRRLGRLHHRILYFVGRNPRVSVTGLLGILGVSKQAINAPLRQLTEMKLIAVGGRGEDRRVRTLSLTEAGQKLEAELAGVQTRQLETAFAAAGSDSEAGWRAVMAQLADRTP